MTGAPDYGYPWWLNYGHLVVTAPAALLWLIAIRRRWPRALVVLVAAVTLWSRSGLSRRTVRPERERADDAADGSTSSNRARDACSTSARAPGGRP